MNNNCTGCGPVNNCKTCSSKSTQCTSCSPTKTLCSSGYCGVAPKLSCAQCVQPVKCFPSHHILKDPCKDGVRISKLPKLDFPECGDYMAITHDDVTMRMDWCTLLEQVHKYIIAQGCCGTIITYESVVICKDFKRNDCGAGFEGTVVNVCSTQGQFTSVLSQADADAQADAWVNANGQSIANETGSCLIIYNSAEYSGDFQKNNCGVGYTGSVVTLTCPQGQFTSIVSQVDANQKAINWVNDNGQSNANTNGTCTKDIIDVTGVTLNKSAITLTEIFDSEALIATVNPSDATNKNVVWSSDNSTVASVSQAGVVSAIVPGNATISVVTSDGGFIAQCNVTVVEAPTEYIVEIQTTSPNQTINNLTRLGSTLGDGKAQIAWGDGSVENIIAPVPEVYTPFPDRSYSQPVGFSHAYTSAGTYTVKIKASNKVNDITFSTVVLQSAESPYTDPILQSYLISATKIKSSVISTINYIFAGQTEFDLTAGFLFETPEVITAAGSLYACSKFNPKSNLLLSQLTKLVYLFWTFRDSGIEAIPVGFLDSQVNVINALDSFRGCAKLGFGHLENDYLPMTLLQKMTKLDISDGMFNYCSGMWGGGDNYKIQLEKKLFLGLNIRSANYMFYKVSRFMVEPNFFEYIKHSLASIEGIFFDSNLVSTRMGGYNSHDPNFTITLQDIFPDASYPNITNMIGAFTPFTDDIIYGFNSNHDDGPDYIPVKLDAADFVTKFPNCKEGSLPVDYYLGSDGRLGAIANLSANSINYASVPAAWTTLSPIA